MNQINSWINLKFIIKPFLWRRTATVTGNKTLLILATRIPLFWNPWPCQRKATSVSDLAQTEQSFNKIKQKKNKQIGKQRDKEVYRIDRPSALDLSPLTVFRSLWTSVCGRSSNIKRGWARVVLRPVGETRRRGEVKEVNRRCCVRYWFRRSTEFANVPYSIDRFGITSPFGYEALFLLWGVSVY